MNRIKQLIWAITSKYKDIDKSYLNEYLNNKEIDVFYKLNKMEQHHSIRVCRDSIEYISNIQEKNFDINKMAKIALMHDIGKINKSLNVFEKCLVVILDKVTGGKMRSYTNIKIFDVYYNHAKMSCDVLKSIGNYDEEFIQAIAKHHSDSTWDNKYLHILKEMDDRN